MLDAIKLPSSGVSQNKFINGRYPMSTLFGPTIWKFAVNSNHNGHMLDAIKLPSSGVSQNKFINGRYPMSTLFGPTIWKFAVNSNHNGAEIN